MRRALLLFAASCLLPFGAKAAILAPFEIGRATAALGGSAILNMTTTVDCTKLNNVLLVAVGVGATTAFASVPTDGTTNVYNQIANIAGSVTRVGIFVTQAFNINSGGGPNAGLPSGSTIAFHYGATTQNQHAIAICMPGTSTLAGVAIDDTIGTFATGTSTAVTNTPLAPGAAPRYVNELGFAISSITLGASDTWTEQANCTPLTPVLSTDALRICYIQNLGQPTPTYSATAGTIRAWFSVYKPFTTAKCQMAGSGAGTC